MGRGGPPHMSDYNRNYSCMAKLESLQAYVHHCENYISISFHIEWDMNHDHGDSSVPFGSNRQFHSVQNRKENCHHDHIPFNLKGYGNIIFSVFYTSFRLRTDILHMEKWANIMVGI